MDVHVTSFEQCDDWDAFVQSHPKGTVFHTSAFCRVLQATRGHQVYAIAAIDKSGTIRALLVAALVATLRPLGKLAARSIMYAQPICSDDRMGGDMLAELVKHHDEHMKRRALFCEVRPIHNCDREHDVMSACRYERLGYINYELDVTVSEAQLWKQIDAQCRRDIRRSLRRGVVVRQGNMADDIDVLYAHLRQSFNHARIPLADKSLFTAAMKELPRERIALSIAEYQDTPIASTCNLIYNGRVYCWYAGVVRTKGIAAHSCLVWNAIRQGAADGQQLFDFAGAGWTNQHYGPGRFKRRFGGKRVEYGRYRRIYSPVTLCAAEAAYGCVRGLLAPDQPELEHTLQSGNRSVV